VLEIGRNYLQVEATGKQIVHRYQSQMLKQRVSKSAAATLQVIVGISNDLSGESPNVVVKNVSVG